MINTFIAYDDQDYELGEFFIDSHSDLYNEFSKCEFIYSTSIGGLDCNEMYINSSLQKVVGKNFVFIALSHGNDEQLVANEIFVSINNTNTFCNSLFYSCACSTGYSLADNLMDAGCLAFIGYSDTISIIVEYSEVFYTCQNLGIKYFLTKEITLEESFSEMVDYYNQEIDRLVVGSEDDAIAASTLVENLDCLVFKGNGSLNKEYFMS